MSLCSSMVIGKDVMSTPDLIGLGQSWDFKPEKSEPESKAISELVTFGLAKVNTKEKIYH